MHKIMIVDDEKDVRESLEQVLHLAGYKVVTASSGAEALNYLMTNDVSMILVDLSMPGMTGEELLKRLSLEKKMPPALVITAMAPWQTLGIIEYGIGYIRKPIDNGMLLEIIGSMIRKESKDEITCAG